MIRLGTFKHIFFVHFTIRPGTRGIFLGQYVPLLPPGWLGHQGQAKHHLCISAVQVPSARVNLSSTTIINRSFS